MNDMSSYVHRFRRLATITLSLTLVTGIATVIPQSRALLVNRPYCNTLLYSYYPLEEEPYRRAFGLDGMWETLSGTSYLVTEHYDPRLAALQEASLLTYTVNTQTPLGIYFKDVYVMWGGFCRMTPPVVWHGDKHDPLHYSS